MVFRVYARVARPASRSESLFHVCDTPDRHRACNPQLQPHLSRVYRRDDPWLMTVTTLIQRDQHESANRSRSSNRHHNAHKKKEPCGSFR
jgi:hypothetical protein